MYESVNNMKEKCFPNNKNNDKNNDNTEFITFQYFFVSFKIT